MSFELLKKLQKIMLFMTIICLPLNSLPKAFTLPGVGSILSNYFLFAAILLLVYEYFKFRFEINKKVIKFFAVFVIWQVVCLINGLVTYEYNELLTLEQISKLKAILYFLDKFSINLDELIAIKTWLFLRFSKDILFTNNIIFFVAFYIWHLYKNNFNGAFKDIRKAIICLVIIMGAYSFIELLWLKLDLQFAEDFLINVNPLLYDPKSIHGWWPPLLWNNQLRSICAEPSYFGIISLLCLPFLWNLLYENKNKFVVCALIFYFTLMIAATNARTAVVLVIAEIILLAIFSVVSKNILNKFFIILTVSVLAFSINLIDCRQLLNNGNINGISVEKYLERNVGSITETNARSNSARLANLIANLETIKQYPIFGVGTGLKDGYMYNNLPEFSYTNFEVRNWSRYLYNEGVLKAGYPALNHFADIAVQNGLVGLILYFLPFLYLCKKLLKYKTIVTNDSRVICLIIPMIALLGAMMSNAGFVICNGIVWGLLYCKVSSVKSEIE